MAEPPANILDELEDLFAWSPAAHTPGPLHLVHISPEIEGFRQATFYDMHLATSCICKRIVHVKNLHRKISAIVNEKLEKIWPKCLGLLTKRDVEGDYIRGADF